MKLDGGYRLITFPQAKKVEENAPRYLRVLENKYFFLTVIVLAVIALCVIGGGAGSNY